jgi:hypothetical protein
MSGSTMVRSRTRSTEVGNGMFDMLDAIPVAVKQRFRGIWPRAAATRIGG